MSTRSVRDEALTPIQLLPPPHQQACLCAPPPTSKPTDTSYCNLLSADLDSLESSMSPQCFHAISLWSEDQRNLFDEGYDFSSTSIHDPMAVKF